MDIHNIRFSNSLTATKCQNQRHEAIERYKRKFLQVFNTFPSHLPGDLHNTSTKSEGNIESQGETESGGHSEAHLKGQRSRSSDSQHEGRGNGDDHAGGGERNGQRRQAGAQWRGMRGQREGNYSAERNRSGVESGGRQQIQGGFRGVRARQGERNRERYWLKYNPDNN